MLDKDRVFNNHMLLGETITLGGWKLTIDLIMIDILDFDVILDIDFLSIKLR